MVSDLSVSPLEHLEEKDKQNDVLIGTGNVDPSWPLCGFGGCLSCNYPMKVYFAEAKGEKKLLKLERPSRLEAWACCSCGFVCPCSWFDF